MVTFDLYTMHSNGEKSLKRKNVVMDSEQSVKKFVKQISEQTGFTHSYELVEEVGQEVVVEQPQNEIVEDLKARSLQSMDHQPPEEEDDEQEELDGVSWESQSNEEEFPRGWHRRSEFVARDGRVFNKGVEDESLFRTKEPSEY